MAYPQGTRVDSATGKVTYPAGYDDKGVKITTPPPANTSSSSTTPPALKDFQYINTSGNPVTFQSADAESALSALSGFKDADPHSGVITPPDVPGKSNGVTSSSGTSRTDEKKMGKTITDTSNPAYKTSTTDLSYIQDYIDKLDKRFEKELASTGSTYDAKQRSLKGTQDKETASTSVALARAGGYLGTSGSGMGVLANLAQTHYNEMQDLEGQRQAALLAARNSYEDKRFDAAKLYSDKASEIEKKAYDRQQEFFKEVKKQNAQIDIYNTITDGVTDPQKIFEKLNGKVDIKEISDFLENSKPVSNSNSTFKFSNEDMAHLMGAGFAKTDVEALQSYVETNGYDEKIRASLTPKERAVADSIYFPKASTGGVGGALTIADAKSLGLPTSLIGRSEENVIADLRNSNPPNWYKEYLVSGWADQKAEVNPEGLKKEWDTFRAKVLGQNITGNDYSVGKAASEADTLFNSIP